MNAETFIKKASFLVNSCKEEALELQYKVGTPGPSTARRASR